MRLEAQTHILFESPAPTPMALMLRPRSGYGQWVRSEEYVLEPHVPVVEYTDGFGNVCQRLMTPPGSLRVRTSVCVETADIIDVAPGAPFMPAQDLPDGVLQFLLPSRYCQSDATQIGDLAQAIIAGKAPGYDQVEAIRTWIQSNVEYRYGTSDASTSAADTAESRIGVCRDFAHLGLALSRSLLIPARMVVGYLHELDPMDLHAWFEAFVGGRWYTFDATQKEPRGNRIAIAYGRDAADVALATNYGPLQIVKMKVTVRTVSTD